MAGGMRLGAFFSDGDLGNDPIAIRDLVQAIEGAGFDHLLTNDHVAGGHPDRLGGEKLHTYDVASHEPFVFLAYLAGVTRTLELVTSIVILPQRQTALVAKQAAELDVLSGGRFRLGVGVGRNWMEYELLNEDFHTRGRRVEEQIEVMRLLWTNELVTFEGKYHHVERMGLNPMPIQRPIPVWMGSFTSVYEKVIERAARVADGWMPQFPPNDEFAALLERFRGYARAAGRDPATIGIECGMRLSAKDDPERWVDTALAYQRLGATHLRATTAGGSFASLDDHLKAMVRWHDAVSSALLG